MCSKSEVLDTKKKNQQQKFSAEFEIRGYIIIFKQVGNMVQLNVIVYLVEYHTARHHSGYKKKKLIYKAGKMDGKQGSPKKTSQ